MRGRRQQLLTVFARVGSGPIATTLRRPGRPTKPKHAAPPSGGRRVKRVVRRVDVRSVLRFSLLFYACLFVVFLVAGILLWLVASVTGVIDNIETFIEELFALESFHFVATQILQGVVFGGIVMVLLGTGLSLLMAVLYNLISDVVGGVEVSVVDDEGGRRPVV